MIWKITKARILEASLRAEGLERIALMRLLCPEAMSPTTPLSFCLPPNYNTCFWRSRRDICSGGPNSRGRVGLLALVGVGRDSA